MNFLYKLYRIFRLCFYKTLLLFIEILLGLKLLYKIIVKNFLRPFLKEYAIYFLAYVFFLFIDLIAFIFRPITIIVVAFLKAILILFFKMLENLCFLYFFIWEVAEFKEHKRKLCAFFYLVCLITLWSFYLFIFLPNWYEGLCNCCIKQGESRCGLMYFALILWTFVFQELLRALRYFYEKYVRY